MRKQWIPGPPEYEARIFPPLTVHGFPRLLYNVTEGQRLETTFGINVKGVTPFPTLLSGSISSLADTART